LQGGEDRATMDFHPVEANLREMFRSLTDCRERAEVVDAEGVWIANLSAAFQMFNAVFLSAPVADEKALERRIATGTQFMMARGLPWSFWICEEWLAGPVRRKCERICARNGLRLAAEMPGMAAERVNRPDRQVPELEYRRVENERERREFCAIGSVCFHVPSDWFDEIFDSRMKDRHDFEGWIGYLQGEPVATAATVISSGVVGVYNVAVLPAFRRRGYAEAIIRQACEHAQERTGLERVILQSTRQAIGMYERLGFSPVTRILVFTT
jgi:ribosomal protein S18 acetylase RimI-like enzyme